MVKDWWVVTYNKAQGRPCKDIAKEKLKGNSYTTFKRSFFYHLLLSLYHLILFFVPFSLLKSQAILGITSPKGDFK